MGFFLKEGVKSSGQGKLHIPLNFLQCNPNEVVGNNIELVFPNDPIQAEHPYCLSGGPIGWTINGVAIYNPFALGEVNETVVEYLSL